MLGLESDPLDPLLSIPSAITRWTFGHLLANTNVAERLFVPVGLACLSMVSCSPSRTHTLEPQEPTSSLAPAHVAWQQKPPLRPAPWSGDADVVRLLESHSVQVSGQSVTTSVVIARYATTEVGARSLADLQVPPDAHLIEAEVACEGQATRRVQLADGGPVGLHRLSAGCATFTSYRLPTVPLSTYFGEWSFGAVEPVVRAEVSLRAPMDQRFSVALRGGHQHASSSGPVRQWTWAFFRIATTGSEPDMPDFRETTDGMALTFYESWDSFGSSILPAYEAALADAGAIAEVAELVLGDQRGRNEGTLMRIQSFTATHFRHHDERSFYPATVANVLRNGSADCKEKSLLFVALARRAGFVAHIALVRTYPAGPFQFGAPGWQFDHALAYMPEQPGLEGPRFIDATAVGFGTALPEQDQGGTAYVLDVRRPFLRHVPFAAAESEGSRISLRVVVDGSGNGKAKLHAEYRGNTAASFRRSAISNQLGDAAIAFRGLLSARSVDIFEARGLECIDCAPRLRASFSGAKIAERDGERLIIKVPMFLTPGEWGLATRRFGLVLGSPVSTQWSVDFTPAGGSLSGEAGERSIRTRCQEFSEAWSFGGGRLTLVRNFASRCVSIPPSEYAENREFVRSMWGLIDRGVVGRWEGR